MPPPIQSVAKPFLEFLLSISCKSVTNTLVPEAPIGCPRAMAPPLTFTFSLGIPKSFITAKLCAANASFDSTKSKSLISQPAFFKACFDAGIGPDPIKDGSTPHVAQETILPNGFKFLFLASLAFIKTNAAAPSLIPEALPGVTPCYVRLSVGIEHPDDIISDLKQALDAAGKAKLKAVS